MLKKTTAQCPESEENTKPCNCCCIETLYTILDGEACEQQSQELMAHIEKCLPCYQQYDLEVAIREVLKTHLQKKEVPQDLIESIKMKISNFYV
ncbi:MAG: anti-sigma factor [Thermonemataceae bacterium]|nr:anti-sigma factor [Thermonemataceae bacterium]